MDQDQQNDVTQNEQPTQNDAEIVDQEAAQEEDFARLFEESSKTSQRFEPGQKIKSKVVSISGEFAYLDLSGKSDGVVDIKEFIDDEGKCVVQEGSEIDVFFVSYEKGLRKFTTLIRGYSTLSLSGLRDAHEAGLPVNGKVVAELKGGYEVNVGKVRCFCPFSHIDLRGSRDATSYVGQTFPCQSPRIQGKRP